MQFKKHTSEGSILLHTMKKVPNPLEAGKIYEINGVRLQFVKEKGLHIPEGIYFNRSDLKKLGFID